MKLIKQLGGYDEAKKLHDNVSCGSTATYVDGCFYSKESLGLFLLEHRRENNIFETGDKVIYPWIGNAICVYDSECIVKTPCIHATDEEIKAGHRL